MSDEKTESSPAGAALPRPPIEEAVRVMERLLEAAAVSKVYGTPIQQGVTLLIPAAEVVAVAGFGLRSGAGTASHREGENSRGGGGDGGGGGKALARSVAVIVASPEGVRVKPVIDFTKIALAALTAAGFVVANWRGLARPKRFFRD